MKRFTTEEFIKEAKSIHNTKYDYSEVNYIDNKHKVKIFCKNCQKFFYQTPNGHLTGNGCPYCKESKGELYIKNWLDLHKIKYETQKRFKDCKDKKTLPFDFYLPDYNTCIEFQGKQHYKEGFSIYLKRYKTLNLATSAFKKQILHDKLKQQYCNKQNISLLIIKYNKNIDIFLSNSLIKK